MNAIVFLDNNEALTTTTAIADGAKRTHESVIKVVRNNLSDFEDFGRVRFEIQPFETLGGVQSREVALLNEHQATLLLTFMRNTPIVKEFKKRLVREFYSMAKPMSTLQILESALKAEKDKLRLEAEKEVLECQVIALKPKVEALDRISLAQGSLCITDAAKTLQVKPKDLKAFLLDIKWIYARTGTTKPVGFQVRLDQGLLEHKQHEYETKDEFGQPALGVNTQVRVTPKGLTKLSELIVSSIDFSTEKCIIG